MQQEVVLAMLAKEPSSGSRLRARLNDALGPLGEDVNDGQIYVTLSRLEKAGFIVRRGTGVPETGDKVAEAGRKVPEAGRKVPEAGRKVPEAGRKVYELTPAGQERVAEWLSEVSWPKPDLAEFHLKLVAAAQAGLADPISIVDAQRRELLRRLWEVERAAMAEPNGSQAGLLLEGIVLRLQADLRWLEACERAWTDRRKR